MKSSSPLDYWGNKAILQGIKAMNQMYIKKKIFFPKRKKNRDYFDQKLDALCPLSPLFIWVGIHLFIYVLTPP